MKRIHAAILRTEIIMIMRPLIMVFVGPSLKSSYHIKTMMPARYLYRHRVEVRRNTPDSRLNGVCTDAHSIPK